MGKSYRGEDRERWAERRKHDEDRHIRREKKKGMLGEDPQKKKEREDRNDREDYYNRY